MDDRKVEFLDVTLIETWGERRAIQTEAVDKLAESISQIGLRTPISVRYYEDRPADAPPGQTDDAIVLMTGAHRLAAIKKLGWDKVECFVHYAGDEIDAELWEIAENLHRAELTALERDEQVARWIELVEQKVSAQHVQKPQGGRPEGGISAASRELGINRMDASRATKVAGLSDEAKDYAREHDLSDNRTALLNASRQETPQAQVHYLNTHHKKPKRAPLSDEEVVEKQYTRIIKAWDAAGPEARQRAREYIDAPVMDDRFGRSA